MFSLGYNKQHENESYARSGISGPDAGTVAGIVIGTLTALLVLVILVSYVTKSLVVMMLIIILVLLCNDFSHMCLKMDRCFLVFRVNFRWCWYCTVSFS